MNLPSGTRIGHYEIVAAVGAGGMGEVYRARDTRLNRDAALKLVPDTLAENPERLARLTREAQALAALNHPNIAQVYGIEEHGGLRALAMELVDGEDLRHRIARGGMSHRDALAIAVQVAAALEAAHEKGIIHRDLKPANIMLDSAGRVKVLDFGLAKTVESVPTADATESPTFTSPAHLTSEGMIVGTAAYMSPEQATGRLADKRSDIWSFGCVLFELLAGKRAFDSSDIHSALAAVLTKEPDWAALDGCPPLMLRLTRRCLDKDRRRRLADAADARIEIEDELAGTSSLVATAASAPLRMSGGSRAAWIVAAVATAIAASSVWLWAPWRVEPRAPMTRLNADLGAPVSLVTAQGVGAIVSPDGSTLVFVGQSRVPGTMPQLYVRRLAELTAEPLPGTAGAMSPFYSPDGSWVGFFAGAKLKKVALAGGGAIELAGAPNGRGGSWGDDDHIVFMPDFYSGLWRMPSSGGSPTRLTTPRGSSGTHRWPQVLPGSRAVIYTSHAALTGYEDAEVILQPLPSGPEVVLQKGAFFGRYTRSGHLVFMREGSLFAAPFNLDRFELTGQAVPVLKDVANGVFWTGAAQFAASDDGLLVYQSQANSETPISWLNNAGLTSSLRATPTMWSDPAFSPDGQRLAVTLYDGKRSDVWIYDWARDGLSRLTRHAAPAFKPVWTPDGSRVAFTVTRGAAGVFDIAWQRADGSGDVQRLTAGPNGQAASSFHPSGKFLAISELDPQTSFDVMTVPLEGDEANGWTAGTPTPFARTAALEVEPMFSPDGRWLAYSSNESGRFEVYVRPFPGPGGVWQISREGGTFPTWSLARRELIYGTLDQRLMAVSYETEAQSFRATAPRSWAPARYQLLGPVITRSFDLHRDGTRVAMVTAAEEGAAGDRVVIVSGFFDELKRLTGAPR